MYIRTKDKSGKPIFGVRGEVYIREGAYIREEKHFLQFTVCQIPFSFFFFQYQSRMFAFFTSCKMGYMFRVDNKDTTIRKVNIKVKNKDTVDVVLATLSLTLRTFHFLLVFLLLTLIS